MLNPFNQLSCRANVPRLTTRCLAEATQPLARSRVKAPLLTAHFRANASQSSAGRRAKAPTYSAVVLKPLH